MAAQTTNPRGADAGMPAPETTSFPALLVLNASRWPAEVAMREKSLGIWQQYTWADCARIAGEIALGFRSLGLSAGESVALIGQNRSHWMLAEVATHACGAMSLGIYKDSLRDEVSYLLEFCGVRIAFVEDEEQVDKLIELADAIPHVERIVYADARGMWKHDDPRLMPLSELRAIGRAELEKSPDAFERLAAQADPKAIAILCTTSGTTSHPKPAMLASGPFLGHAAALLAAEPKGPDDEYVSVLPMPWIGEQLAIAEWLVARFKFNLPEEDETSSNDMREIGPTALLWPPRAWEGLAAQVKADMMDASPLKRWAYALGMRLGAQALERGRRSALADLLVGRALRDRMGFSRLRFATTGGAALGPDTFRLFRSIGVPLSQVYGQTELCGVWCTHRPGDVDYETVGLPLDGVELRIEGADRNGIGEIVARHPGMFTGYFRNEEATRADLRDGWMHTGDAGYLRDDGHLVVIDRVKDLSTLSDGDRFSPQYIENKLKFSAHIGECVVLGDKREFVTAMICIRFSIVSKWAENRRIAFTTYSDLSSRPEVGELIRREVEEVNEALPERQKVRRILLLYKELDADDGELTRTRKVRRGTINERYASLIEALYSDASSVPVDTTITLQDGRTTRITANLAIHDLGRASAAAGAHA